MSTEIDNMIAVFSRSISIVDIFTAIWSIHVNACAVDSVLISDYITVYTIGISG